MVAAALSTTRQAVAAISRDYCRPLLKPLGFKSRGTGLWRDSDGLLHDVAFQSSMWGSAAAGRFTINVGVTHPDMYHLFTGKPGPKHVSGAHWPIQERIGFLAPELRDVWWEVDERTDVAALGTQVAGVVAAYAVPFLDQFTSRESFGAYLDSGRAIGTPPLQLQIARALFAFCEGRSDAAVAKLNSTLEELAGRPGTQLVRMVLETLQARSNDA